MKAEEQIINQIGRKDFRLLFNDGELKERVKALAYEINRDFANSKTLKIIGVLKGSFIFIADLVRELKIPVHIEFITASSYSKMQSTGIVSIRENTFTTLQGKDVLIIEDIIDSGLTIKTLVDFIKEKGPNSLKVCALFMKPDKIKESICKIDYVGFHLKDEFVVGYGLDFDQRYRELPHVIELLNSEL